MKSIRIDMTKFTSNTYYKYLASYILLLAVPLFLITIFVDVSLFETYEEEVVTNEINKLHQVEDGVEVFFEQLYRIKSSLYLSTFQDKFYFEDDPLKGMEFIRTLQRSKITNSNFEDIIFYFCGDDYIYTSKTSSRFKRFTEDYMTYENWDNNLVKFAFNNLTETLARPVEYISFGDDLTGHFASIYFPLKSRSDKPYAVMGFIIQEEFFKSKISGVIDDNSGTTIILNSKNQVMTSSSSDEFMNTPEFNIFINSPELFNSDRITLNGRDYISTCIVSEGSGWSYLTLTSRSYINSKLRTVKLIFFIGMLIVVIIGAVSIYLFMIMNYNPIKKLQTYSREIFSNGDGAGELDQVKDAIDYLADQNLKLTSEVELSGEANRQYITMQILRGNLHKDTGLASKAEKYGVKILGDITVVVIYMDSDTDYALTRKKITKTVVDSFENRVSIYSSEHFDNRKIIMIFDSGDNDFENLYSDLIDIQKQIKEKYNTPTVFGVGNSYSDSNLIPKAYMEASTAVDYRMVKGNDCVILFKDIIEQQAALESYPKANLNRIGIFLKAGNMEAIDGELDKIVTFIKENNAPIFTAKGLCFDIINLIFQTGQQILAELNLGDMKIPDTFALTGYNTVDDLIDIIRDLSSDLSRKIINQKEIEDKSLIGDMKNYIYDNYTDFNFSLLGMADVFNMSQSALSTYFKEKTDQTILNYITSMKMEKSRELLRTTELPVTQVAEVVGYNNVTSFIRRFKQWEGQTPGDYRKKNTSFP